MVKAIVEQAKIRAIVELQAMDRLEAEQFRVRNGTPCGRLLGGCVL
jgi:hypothetical protein